jgi:hypothetical protein
MQEAHRDTGIDIRKIDFTMKKPAIALLLIIVITGITIPGVTAFGQTNHIPHEYPTEREGLLDELELLRSYSLIGNMASERRYQDAQRMLQDFGNIELPESIRYIIDSYNNLYEKLVDDVDNIGLVLDEVSSLLSGNWLDEAKQELNDAQTTIQHAYFLLEDINVLSDTLISEIDELIGAITTNLEASRIVEGNISQLEEVINELDARRSELADRYVSASGLLSTELSLNIYSENFTLGDSITLSGELTSNGNPLIQKKLNIIIGNKVINISTDIAGVYSVDTVIPYEYVNSMRLIAIYEPEGVDIYTYAASQSPAVVINTVYYPTEINISSPGEVYTGFPFTISGTFTGTSDGTYRSVAVSIGTTKIAEQEVPDRFSIDITVPETIASGEHDLTVSVKPAQQYAGVVIKQNLTVLRPGFFSDVQSPSLTLLPDSIEISGRIYNEAGPVADAIVHIKINNLTGTTRTSQDGFFTGIIRISTMPDAEPLASNPFYFIIAGDSTYNVSPIGSQQIEIMIESPASQELISTATKQLITINPVTGGPILAIILYLGFLIYRWYRVRNRQSMFEDRRESEAPATVVGARRPDYKLTGIRHRIFSAYRKGLRAVEKSTGVIMEPSLTLREYLGLAAIPPVYYQQFSELTSLAESALYAGLNPTEGSAALAEEYANGIQEVVQHGDS